MACFHTNVPQGSALSGKHDRPRPPSETLRGRLASTSLPLRLLPLSKPPLHKLRDPHLHCQHEILHPDGHPPHRRGPPPERNLPLPLPLPLLVLVLGSRHNKQTLWRFFFHMSVRRGRGRRLPASRRNPLTYPRSLKVTGSEPQPPPLLRTGVCPCLKKQSIPTQTTISLRILPGHATTSADQAALRHKPWLTRGIGKT